MRITLIGMSGVGKTHLAKKLEKAGFIRYTIDDIIEEKLQDELKKYGYKGVNDMSKWMGQPYDDHYPQRSKRYLELERKAIEEVLKLVKSTSDEKVVIDTTGSVVYHDESLLKELATLTTIIYLKTSDDIVEIMKQKYFEDPKPVFWGESYHMKASETSEGALRRCYSDLLQYRRVRYEKHSHVAVQDKMLYKKQFSLDQFFDYVKKN